MTRRVVGDDNPGMKVIIVLALAAILTALASAGLLMLRRQDDSETARATGMARALAWRVGLSVALFAFVMLAWWMGWIAPHGI